MNYNFHPQAKHELHQAINYYEDCKKGLGKTFAKEVHKTIQRIVEFPKAWSSLSPNTRRCLTNRFPFGIIYQPSKNNCLIIAIAQLNRKPNYWINRIE